HHGVLPHAPRESPWVITVPLVLLAIPSVMIGWVTIKPLLYGGWFGSAIKVLPGHDVLACVPERTVLDRGRGIPGGDLRVPVQSRRRRSRRADVPAGIQDAYPQV